jgi:uncharacterized protein HemY
MSALSKYPSADQAGMSLAEPATILQRLNLQKRDLENRLENVNAALEAMNKQPEVAELLERVMKVV